MTPSGKGGGLQVIDLFGGPDRDRTDDLFHAISRTNYNLLTFEGLRRPLSPKSAPGTAYCSLIAPKTELLLPRAKPFIFIEFFRLRSGQQNGWVVGSGPLDRIQTGENGYSVAMARVWKSSP
jgi:hypothetical protein